MYFWEFIRLILQLTNMLFPVCVLLSNLRFVYLILPCSSYFHLVLFYENSFPCHIINMLSYSFAVNFYFLKGNLSTTIPVITLFGYLFQLFCFMAILFKSGLIFLWSYQPLSQVRNAGGGIQTTCSSLWHSCEFKKREKNVATLGVPEIIKSHWLPMLTMLALNHVFIPVTNISSIQIKNWESSNSIIITSCIASAVWQVPCVCIYLWEYSLNFAATMWNIYYL